MYEQLYMLRLWEDEAGEEQSWKASLKEMRTKEVHYFGSLESLVRFLKQVAAGEKPAVEEAP